MSRFEEKEIISSILNILNLKYADVEYAIRYSIELRKWCMLKIKGGSHKHINGS